MPAPAPPARAGESPPRAWFKIKLIYWTKSDSGVTVAPGTVGYNAQDYAERAQTMTSALTKARVLRIKVEEGKTGLFYATSPDLKGLLVAEPTMDALEEAIPKVITDMYAACGVKIVVAKAGDNDPEYF